SGLPELLHEFKRSVLDRGLVDYISLNDNEARIISSVLCNHDLPQNYTADDISKTARLISDRTGSRVDIHTGTISFSSQDRDVVSANCHRVLQKTVTGAGDVWEAADLMGYLTGLDTEDRLRFANAAAALYVSRESAATPTAQEILEFMEEEQKDEEISSH
ncbi:MAG: PfkB family carbohydrate kinase, partial [Rhabdochlamydiaceae bacterium]